MSILNKPEYSSVKIILLVAAVGVLGYFVFFSGGARGLDQAGKAVSETLVDEVLPGGMPGGEFGGVSISTEFVSSEAVIVEPADAPGEKDVATFVVTFLVSAEGGDAFLDKSCKENSANVDGQGVEYFLRTKSQNTPIACVFAVTDGILGDGDFSYIVPEGESREFALSVSVQADADHTTQMLLGSLNWGIEGGEANVDQFYSTGFGPASEYKTDMLFLNVM